MTTCLRPVVSSLQPKLSLIKVRSSASQSALARPASTIFHEEVKLSSRKTAATSTENAVQPPTAGSSAWTESRCLFAVGSISSCLKLEDRVGHYPVTWLMECHSYDPLLHGIPTKCLPLSEDDIIVSSVDQVSSRVEEDLRRVVCSVTTLAEALPYQVSVWHRQCSPLSEYEKSMILATDAKNPDPTAKRLDPLEKPSEEQLEKILLTLSNNLPSFFTTTFDYTIYHSELIFHNNIRGVTTYGLGAYIRQMSLLRLIGHFKFAYVKMDILKVTKHIEDGTVRVRWRIRGIPGYKVLFQFWKFRVWSYKEMLTHESDWFDGFSTFHVGGDGLVHKHVCDKMMPDEQKETTGNLAAKLAFLLGAIPRPTVDDLGAMVLALSRLQNVEHIECS